MHLHTFTHTLTPIHTYTHTLSHSSHSFTHLTSPRRYEITELVPNSKIVLKGDSDSVVAVDTILISPLEGNPNATKVDYTADLTLKGWKRPFIVLLSGALNKLGRDAMTGLENYLNKEKTGA